ncbi:MAG: N-6 DNA methylase [Prevotellaceae bacterium]|jgi:type I restriction enzyme M protein|nr:N-6 DNA methylase [Prevotellaceae bacterium]
MEIHNIIDSARDILVGKLPNPQDQIDTITYTLMYKFMSDIDDESASLGGKRVYFSGDYEKYDWHNLMRVDGQEQLVLFREAIEKMSRNFNLPELFREIFNGALLKFNDPRTLRLFLKEMDKFTHGENDDLGDAYEYLLSIMSSQGGLGQFRTPRHIIEFIVNVVDPDKNDRIIDPACGTAGFLIEAYKHIQQKHDGKDETGKSNEEERLTAQELERIHHNFRGFDIDPTMIRTARVNMYLHGFKTPDIIEHDTLTSEEFWNERYDIILANPPFMTPKGGIQPHKKFSVQAKRSEVLFVDYMASHLKPRGRAGFIVPEGIIFQSGNAYRQLRENLVKNSLIAVISLPGGIFQPYSGVKTSILLLNPELAKTRDSVLFVKVENDGFSLGTQRRPIAKNDMPAVLETISCFQKTGKLPEESPQISAQLVPRNEIMKSGDYNLSGERYTVAENISTKYDLVPLGELADISTGKKDVNQGNPNGKYPFFTCAREHTFSDEYSYDEEAILIAGNGDVGHCKYYKGKFEAYQRTYILSNFKNVEPQFLIAVLNNSLKAILEKQKLGNTMPYIKMGMLADFQIPLPPLSIQKEIVAEIENKQRSIDAANSIKNLELRITRKEIGEDFQMMKLGEVFKTASGGTPLKTKTEYYDGGTIPWLGSGELSQGVITSSKYFITQKGMDESSAKLFPKDSVLVAMYGATVGQVGILKFESTTNQAVCAIFPNEKIANPEYIYLWIKSQKANLIKVSVGGAQPNISQQIIKNIEIPIPPLSVQEKIVSKYGEIERIKAGNARLVEILRGEIAAVLRSITN